MLGLSLLLVLLPCSTYSMLLGWVESPGYPSGYLPHASVRWNRCAGKGHTLTLKLIHLDVEDSQNCENDAVKVFSNGKLIAALCGKMDFEELQSTVNPSLASTPGGCLSLSFHSDFSNTRRYTGFRGFYSEEDFDECEDPDNKCSQFCHNFIGGYRCSCHHGYFLSTDNHTCTVSCSEDLSGMKKGLISSPSWPGSYAQNANCQYRLSVEAHLQLVLHFSEAFDVEQSPDGQCIDALRIETGSETLGPFCGHKPPPSPLLTHSHHVIIKFTTDGYGTNKGFTLDFKTRPKVCRAVVTSHSTAAPLRPQHQPGQTVTVTCDPGYFVNTKNILTLPTQYKATCQSTGTWTPNYPCEPVDCGHPVIPNDGILQLVDSDNLHTQYQDRIEFNCSSKYYTLEGDDSYTCSASGEWISAAGASKMPTCIPVCGKPETVQPSAGRIMGGVTAKLGEIPWALLIKAPNRGGASLISDRWAVTAAHVVENIGEASLRLYGGVVDGRLTSNSLSDVVVMNSEKIIIHPGYIRGTVSRTNFNHDIALIRLASRVRFGPNLLPICLPGVNSRLEEGDLGTISGWGKIDVQNNKFVTSHMLKYAHISVYSDLNECQNTPYNDKAGSHMDFTANMFCAGAPGKDSCLQDSGGAFVSPMVSAGEGPYYMTGIVSWGAPCKLRNYKGYYTKVENYVDWIKETIDTVDNSFLLGSVCECWLLPPSKPLMYGELQSPEYPQPYPPNLEQRWDLSVPEGYQIQLTFTHMDIEASASCYYDSLTVLYGERVLGRFCGNENSADGHHSGDQPILSPGNRLTLIFKTDNSNPERQNNVGFSAYYQAIDIDECSAATPGDNSGPLCDQICLNTLGSFLCACHHGYKLHSDQHTCTLSCVGGVFNEAEGTLFSPGYPVSPPHAISCQYIISVQSGFIVSLNFSDNFQIESVDTEQGPVCVYHWLQVTVPDRDPVKLCGTTSPGVIVTNSNTVTLDYHTDDDGLSRGWSLEYSTHRVPCPLPGSIAKGRVTPNLPAYLYRDYIYVRCDQGYKLMTDGEEIESFTTMCQSNGHWHLPLPECHIIDCGKPESLLNGKVDFLSGSENQYHSVVQYSCNEPFYTPLGRENVNYTCDADRKWRSDNDIHVLPTCLPVCGRPTRSLSSTSYQRIVGGSSAPADTIPWQVLVSVNGRGGGMVIADRWIMTAAHVLTQYGDPPPTGSVQIHMGRTDIQTLPTSLSIASIHIHPGYNNSDNLNYNNDIALIKLQEVVTFRASIMPLCLPAQDAAYHTGTMGMVSGFGITDEGTRRFLTNKLKYVHIPVVDQQVCSQTFAKMKQQGNNLIPHLTDNMFCAGVPEGKKDSCQGDSGSAYAIEENSQFWAAGIVSWGVECGKEGKYGVYTKVANYVDWVQKTMQEN
ncbi:uncharacterized protein LOC131471288 [Solea solea]|uniref:uncharacterized protein LOC131471288 n=1 Tax=Solea solea TaxID=90069 RepID=UPI00272D9248|nr:uncharacterized protein LOC131471288 [Solea solea]